MRNCSVSLCFIDITYFLLLKLSTAGMEGNCLRGKYDTRSGKTKYWGTKQHVNLINRETDPRGLTLKQKMEDEKDKKKITTTYQLFRGANHQFIRTLLKLLFALQLFNLLFEFAATKFVTDFLTDIRMSLHSFGS